MRVLAHRGLWLERADQNSAQAFTGALDGGFGIETDIRDQDGQLVVAHDMAVGACPSFADVADAFAGRPPHQVLAINIKADGLAEPVAQILRGRPGLNAFVFDMSVPDTLAYVVRGVPVFARISEYEFDGPLVERAAGVWLDAFHGEWWTLDLVRALASRGKDVAIVSPELHGRHHGACWEALRSLDAATRARCLICTDEPAAAARAFAD